MNLQRLEWYARHLSLPLSRGSGDAVDLPRAVLRGRGVTFAGLREYAYGDDVRAIDWNATARFARPFVKTFHEDRAVDLLLLVDGSASLGEPANPRSKAATARELAALFALVALRQEQRISLLLYTDRVERSVALHRGRHHVNRLLRVLGGTEVSSRGTSLAAALRQVPRLLPHPGFILLISDFAADDDEAALSLASRRHDVLALALVDPAEAELPDVGLVRARDIETGRVAWIDTTSRRSREAWRTAWQNRQRTRHERLARAWVTSVDVAVNRPYFATLKAACRGFATQSASAMKTLALLCLLCVWWHPAAALAQTPAPIVLTSELRPERPQVGQVMELRLTAAWPATVDHVAPRFDNWTGPFEVIDIDAGALQRISDQGSQVWVIRLRTFDIGRVTIAGVPVDFQEVGALGRRSARTDDLVVDSVAPPVERGGSVRPMKDLVVPRRDLADLAVVGGAIVLVGLACVQLAGWLASFHRRRFDRARRFNPRRTLRALRRGYRRRPADVESFYGDISSAARRFLEAAFDIPGTVLSSAEIVAALRAAVRPGQPLDQVSDMLAAVDAVRFGGRIPTDAEMKDVLTLTQTLLLDRRFLSAVPPSTQPTASRTP